MPNNEPTDHLATGDDSPATGSPDTTAPARRGRRRATKAAAVSGVTDGSTEAPVPGALESADVEIRPRRRHKAVAAEVPDESDLSISELAQAPKKAARTRRRAVAEPESTDSPQPELPLGSADQASVEPIDAEPVRPEPRKRRSRAVKSTPAVETVSVTAVEIEPVQPQPEVTKEQPAEPPVASEKPSRRRAAPPTVLFMAAEIPPAPSATSATSATSALTIPPAPAVAPAGPAAGPEETVIEEAEAPRSRRGRRRRGETDEMETVTTTRRTRRTVAVEVEPAPEPPVEHEPIMVEAEFGEEDEDEATSRRRRRGRRGRGRGKGTFDGIDEVEEAPVAEEAVEEGEEEDGEEPLTRRRRRRRRSGSATEPEGGAEDGVVTVVKIREPRTTTRDQVQGVTGSTRLEAKRQRRRDGREQRRTRPAILSEAEFLARREAVDRVMVVRQKGDRTQIAVLEDGILVEHYVTRQSASTMVGNVYLGKVQNVLPSMEAAFVDIGRGRNAVLYAGEVNWDATGLEGRARSIEQALKSGESVLVQVTKDPVGHKGARLTSHVALSGRHLVYVPNGHASGISRKLSDVERRRLRDVLKNLVPDGAGVIVRTAAEGAAEEDLERDVRRLQAQWEDIRKKSSEGGAPVLLSSEPDLLIRVVRDLFNEDFRELVIQGSTAYEEVAGYLDGVSPDLVTRIRRHTGTADAFAEWRIDEQILKGLDRKVYLPSGGHLVIDRTEAMTVVDVNTGKYTGAGGNLEETVTRNNLEAAEEIVRQLRLRDIGGIIVIDFIDMVLESNRELVLRRLTECLGRDRTKHQVTEITSLGLVQMTRKRIGQGLIEAFSESCDHCKGRGVVIQLEPTSDKPRNNVAEKVRSVAMSVRTDIAEDADFADLDDDAAPDQEVMVGEPMINGRDGDRTFGDGPGRSEDASGPDDGRDGDGDDEHGGSVRRRTRRGSSRRRTRP